MKRILFTALLGLTGYFCQRAWLPRYDAIVTQAPIKLSREQAIEAARQAASAHGLNTTGWTFGVTTDFHQRTASVLADRRSELLASYPLAEIQVAGFHAASASSVNVLLAPDGRVLSWQLHDSRLRQRRDDKDLPEAAEAQFRAAVGEEAHRYEKTVSGAHSQDGFRTTWEAPDPARPGVLLRYSVLVRANRIVQSELGLEVGDAALSPAQRESQSVLLRLLPTITAYTWLVIILTLWMFFSAFLRRYDHLQMGVAAALITLPWIALDLGSGGGSNRVALSNAVAPGSVVAGRLLVLVTELIPALLAAILLSAGYAKLPGSERRAWLGIKLLSERRVWARPVGREIAAGLMFGAAMCAVVLLPAQLGLCTYTSPSSVQDRLLLPVPVFKSMNAATYWIVLVPLAILIPWFRSLKGKLQWLLVPALLLGSVSFMDLGAVSRFDWKATALACSGLYGLTLLAYRMWGLLAATLAPASAMTLYLASSLLAMPAEKLQTTGWFTLLAWSGALFVGVVVGWRGEEAPEAEVMARMDPPSTSVNRSERKRLQADFDVARRAQQDMLPDSPPRVPGYTFAGSCRPALEVGGDLFDYLEFHSGELGLCVADVSGKGVSASLYMTMTKGMLTAALEEPADLVSILSRLNRHLKDWGRKRTFVTMSLALLDPASGKLRHARAGHNPPVLLQEGRARLLQPAGLGLGMAGPAAFDRTLKVEELSLNPGDCFVLYSDGLTECMNRDLEQFGEDRLLHVIEESAGLPAGEVEEAILRAVTEFQADAEAHDDLTILVVRREHDAAAALP